MVDSCGQYAERVVDLTLLWDGERSLDPLMYLPRVATSGFIVGDDRSAIGRRTSEYCARVEGDALVKCL
jgi:hypothetical protein